jgi:5'-phosphate synthase pdxT subunit
MVRAGVLALQGDFALHARALERAGAEVRVLRRVDELAGVEALVLPGGESTALLRLMVHEEWLDALRDFHGRGGALLGTCAGAILLAREVHPAQPSLGLLDASIARNAYGRQVDSFEGPLSGEPAGMTGVFIRAPRFLSLGPRVEVLATSGGEPVLVREGRVLAATFHPELTPDARVHGLLIALRAVALKESA